MERYWQNTMEIKDFSCILFPDYKKDFGVNQVIERYSLERVITQINKEFGDRYKIWVCHRDFQRDIMVGVVNQRQIAVKVICLLGSKVIKNVLNEEEIILINEHLNSDAKTDLLLE